MDWRKSTLKKTTYNYSDFSIPNRWLHIYYYEALNILFRIENSLRIFVYTVLKNQFLDNWANIQIEVVEGNKTTIAAIAKKRISQDQDFGYLGYNLSSPLMYLNSGEIIRLITSDEYWKYFAPYFRGRKEIIRNKLDEISNIRNSFAHFRPIKEDDIELIKQNAKHSLMAIEKYLNEMTDTTSVTPTNTEEQWYMKLVTLGTKNCVLTIHQSESAEWIRIQMECKCRIASSNRYGNNYISYQVLNYQTHNIVSNFELITKYNTYVVESIPYLAMPGDLMPEFKKLISFVFLKSNLTTNINEIANSFDDLLKEIEGEIELVISDNLAKGKIVEIKTVSASYIKNDNEEKWDLSTGTLLYPINNRMPSEFWGMIPIYSPDFMASTTKFPWMPGEVSDFDI